MYLLLISQYFTTMSGSWNWFKMCNFEAFFGRIWVMYIVLSNVVFENVYRVNEYIFSADVPDWFYLT